MSITDFISRWWEQGDIYRFIKRIGCDGDYPIEESWDKLFPAYAPYPHEIVEAVLVGAEHTRVRYDDAYKRLMPMGWLETTNDVTDFISLDEIVSFFQEHYASIVPDAPSMTEAFITVCNQIGALAPNRRG